MRSEAKRLRELGLAIHWLHARSKRPIEMGWASSPPLSWADLAQKYRVGYNVGVRLGKASLVEKDFLAVIDCDVKSTEEKHRSEMQTKLNSLWNQKKNTPYVLSGRGNGSAHYYVRTREAARAQLLARSQESVKVVMAGSQQPSKRETEMLTKEEIKRGVRLRPAWEISLLGEGQQVVLPPSIHPDSGKEYRWGVKLLDLNQLPLFNPPTRSKPEGEGKEFTNEGFKAVKVDLVSSSLGNETVDMIMSGAGVEDRSSALFTAANRMLKAGMSDNEILSVLTDRNNYLGCAAYEHAKTHQRGRAALWVRRYTLEKARRETLAQYDFDDEVEIEAVDVPLSESEKAEQEEKLVPEKEWMEQIERGVPEGPPKPSLKNVNLILKNAVSPLVFRRNLFSGTDVYGFSPPWNQARVGDEVRNIDVTNIVHWLVANYRVEVQENKIFQAIAQIASENPFHPVREYLKGLEWDGKPRLDSWLKTYLGAQATEPYLSAVSRKVLCAMVARVMAPGCKYDQVLILEGLQGVGKSTAVRILSDPWFSDAAINIADKDSTIAMRSVWVMEMGELSGMRKADIDQLKAFVTRQVDRIRMPYGRLAEDFPRQCIFIGTTNSSEYLKDETGNRRFWPVKVGKCDFEALKKDRDQLLAEAVFAYELKEPLYLTEVEERSAAEQEQSARTWRDEWLDVIAEFLNSEPENFDVSQFTISELFSDFGALPGTRLDVAYQMRCAYVLKRLGYEKVRKRAEGFQKMFWVKKAK